MQQQIINNRLSNAERETHYLIDHETDNVVTADTTIMKDYTKMKKQGWTLIKQYVYPDGTIVGGCFEAPRHALSIRSATAKKRNVSAAQIEALEKARSRKTITGA